MKKILVLILFSSVLLFSCKSNVESENLTDNNELYESPEAIQLYEFQLTVFRPENNTLADGSFTFEELNQDNGKIPGRDKDMEVSVLLKRLEDGESRPGLLGYGLTEPNAVLEQRGQSARLHDKKSYQINLLKSGGLFKGHEILNFNKHVEDPTKIYNKLSFDLFAESNQLLSLQTNFVNLWIKDLNKTSPKFIDYGLFTQVEEVDENYFRKRNLDSNGHLYKAKIFEFQEYPEAIKLEDALDYSKDDFEYRLDIERLEEHSKLIKMLKDVNNPLIPINDVIEKHFNRENYLTWLASNILLGNVDTASGNYYLYSPQESTTWYFIPWDYDKSLRAYTTNADWQEGLTNYWGSVLHRRFLKNDNNREALTEKVDELYTTVFSSENISKLINSYEPIIRESFSKEPDKKSEEEINALIKALNETRKDIWENKMVYDESLEKPMPFHLGTVVDQGEYVSINWEESYDFQGQSLTYELMISDQPTMDPIIYQFDNLKDTEFILEDLPSGRYYYKVIAKNSEGLTQEPFDIYVNRKTGLYYYGIKTFYIE